MNELRTSIYVDGFNLFYGCVKGTSYKWLDLNRLFNIILAQRNRITEIHYFTAIVSSRSNDPMQPQRQRTYLNALNAYIPEITVHYGHFLQNEVQMRNVNPPPNTVKVIKTEEKGSDVNLAVHLLNDAWLDKYDCGVVVSNDSDLAEAMRLIKKYHPYKKLGLFTPSCKRATARRRVSQELKQHADFVKPILERALVRAQLPDKIPGTRITKPRAW